MAINLGSGEKVKRPVGRPRKDGQPAGSGSVKKGRGVNLRVSISRPVTQVGADNSVPSEGHTAPRTVTVTAASTQKATAEARKLLGGSVRLASRNDDGTFTYTLA